MPLITQAARALEMVARYGSIRRAAERINSAPSAVNRQILNLETEFGTPLFERLPRGMRLTEAGKVVVERIRAWQLENQRTLASVASLKGHGGGHVRIGLMESLAAEFLPQAFHRLQLLHSGASLYATVAGTAEITRQLVADEIDIAVTFNAPRDAGLKFVNEMRFEMGAVMPPDHPLVALKEVRIDDVFDHALVISDNSLTIGPLVDNMLERSRRHPIRTVTTNSVTTLKAMVAQGTGIGILITIDVFSEIRAGSLSFRPLAGARMFEVLSVAARDIKALNPVAHDFTLIIGSMLESLSQAKP